MIKWTQTGNQYFSISIAHHNIYARCIRHTYNTAVAMNCLCGQQNIFCFACPILYTACLEHVFHLILLAKETTEINRKQGIHGMQTYSLFEWESRDGGGCFLLFFSPHPTCLEQSVKHHLCFIKSSLASHGHCGVHCVVEVCIEDRK